MHEFRLFYIYLPSRKNASSFSSGEKRREDKSTVSQEHNLCKLKYISLKEVKTLYFRYLFQSEATKSNFYRLYLKLFRPRSN